MLNFLCIVVLALIMNGIQELTHIHVQYTIYKY